MLCITFLSHIFESVWFVNYDVNIQLALCVSLCACLRVDTVFNEVRRFDLCTPGYEVSVFHHFLCLIMFLISVNSPRREVCLCICGSRAHFLQSKDDFQRTENLTPHLK